MGFYRQRQVLEHFLEKPIKNCANQGDLIHRPGGNHAWTCKLDGYFLKAVDENAPLNVRNLKDHYIQNMLATLDKKKLLPFGIQFPKTLLAVKNIGPAKIKALEAKQNEFHNQLKELDAEIKAILDEKLLDSEKSLLAKKYTSLEDLKTKITTQYGVNLRLKNIEDILFDKLTLLHESITKKAVQLKENLRINKGIETKLNPQNKNKKYIVFIMEDVEKISEKNTTHTSKEVETLETKLQNLNAWLKEHLGVFHWDCKAGRNTMTCNNQTYLIDPAFTVKDPAYAEKFKKLIETRSHSKQ